MKTSDGTRPESLSGSSKRRQGGSDMTTATLANHDKHDLSAEGQTSLVLLALVAGMTLALGLIVAIAAATVTAIVVGVVQHKQAHPKAVFVGEVKVEFADPLTGSERFLKRLIDIVGALVGLVIAMPILVAAAVAIKLDSAGSVFFTQERVGQAGRRFRILKLRTMFDENDGSEHLAYVAALMRGEAPAENGVFKLTADPRVTRVGRTLRKLSIDELPQLINVLLGHMSLVGPRPPMGEEVRMYDDWAWQRLRVKPGLTGLWQVSGRCELNFRDMVALDLRYQESWTPLLELSILLRTPAVVLSSRGAA